MGTAEVLYLGDLDAPGLAILGRVSAQAERDQSFSLLPHEPFYRFLTMHGRRVHRPAVKADRENANAVFAKWFSLDLSIDAAAVLNVDQAVPQESLGIEALVSGAAWTQAAAQTDETMAMMDLSDLMFGDASVSSTALS